MWRKRVIAVLLDADGQTREEEVLEPLGAAVVRWKRDKTQVLKLKTHRRLSVDGTKARDAIDSLVLAQELENLIGAGLNITESIDILRRKRGDRDASGRVLSEIWADIQAGRPVHEAFDRHERQLGPVFCAAVKSGDQGGDLRSALKKVTSHLEAQRAAMEQIQSALLYPGLVLVFGFAVLAFMMVFIMPKFAASGAYASQAHTITTALIAVGKHVSQHASIYALAFVGLSAACVVHIRARGLRATLSGMAQRIPVFRDIAWNLEISGIYRTLATLLASGAGYDEALRITAEVSVSPIHAASLERMRKEVRRGTSMVDALRQANLTPPFVEPLIRSGAESGRMADMLHTASSMLERDALRELSRLAKVAEPVILLVVGIVVGTIVVGMYLPIFDLADSL